MSRVKVIEPPGPAVTLAEAKAQCNITHDEHDDLIQLYIDAAQEKLAGPDGELGICFEPQTLEGALDEFPDGEIRLPYGPVVSVVSVTYTDGDGVSQTVPPGDYVLDEYSAEAWLVPHADTPWPATMATINAVRVRWIAGRGTPKKAKQAILMLVAHAYDHRDAASEQKIEEIPLGVYSLVASLRVISI